MKVDVRRDVTLRIRAGTYGVELKASLGIRLRPAVQARHALCIIMVEPSRIGLVGVHNDALRRRRTVRAEDLAGDNQALSRFVGAGYDADPAHVCRRRRSWRWTRTEQRNRQH